MRLKTIYDIADGIAPFALSAEYMGTYGMHDNSGIQLDCGREIGGILFSLDLSLAAVREAKEGKMNCIFTHHPAIWQGLMRLTREECPALSECVAAGISVISAHLNLDAAEGGIDESLMLGLGGKEASAVMERLHGGGYGRVFDVPPLSMAEFAARAEKTFQTSRVTVYGDKPVKRVASFCGAGFTPAAAGFALENGADTLVTSDPKHHLIAEAVERGLNVLLLTHYAAETYGFRRFYRKMEERTGLPCAFFEDPDLM